MKFCRLTLLLLTGLVLTGCPTQPVKHPGTAATPTAATHHTVQYWLQLAKNVGGTEQVDLLLQAALESVHTKEYSQTKPILGQLFNLPLTPEQTQRWRYLSAIVALSNHDVEGALKLFDGLNFIDPVLQQSYLRWYSEAYRLAANYLEAAKLRITLDKSLRGSNAATEILQTNTEITWSLLTRLEAPYLSLFAKSSSDHRLLQAWLELALLNANNQGKPRQLVTALSLWKKRFAGLTLLQQMPTEFASVSKMRLFNPQAIAILLPQTGRLAPSAQTLRHGIETAYFNNRSSQHPTLRFYDSNRTDILSVYQQAVKDGADFIIGPLQRQRVAALSKAALTVPVLAINRVPQPTLQANFFELGLPIEDEAVQIANEFWRRGFTRAAVLLPDTPVGSRALKAFKAQFERLNGQVVTQRHFIPGQDYTRVVKSLLAVDASEQRRNKMEKILGQSVKFVARRRQDIDAIFMLASPEDGRRLKPLVDYYFGHNIPVFGGSRIDEGIGGSRLDLDLEGVRFIDSPWLLKNDQFVTASEKGLKAIWPQAFDGRGGRLFALGMDAFTLIKQLGVLEAFPHQHLNGTTGRLFLNTKHQIIRQLPWAVFRHGKVKWLGYPDEKTQPD